MDNWYESLHTILKERGYFRDSHEAIKNVPKKLFSGSIIGSSSTLCFLVAHFRLKTKSS